MPRVRMLITRDGFEAHQEWVLSDEEAAAFIDRGWAEALPEIPAAPKGSVDDLNQEEPSDGDRARRV